MLSDTDRDFVRRREALLHWWPWAAAALVAAVLGLWGYLLASGSLLVNPWLLFRRLEDNAVTTGTLAALAMVGSIGFLALGMLMLAMVGVLWGALRTEQRLLRMIRLLDEP